MTPAERQDRGAGKDSTHEERLARLRQLSVDRSAAAANVLKTWMQPREGVGRKRKK